MMNIIDWFDGKKTAIGLVSLAILETGVLEEGTIESRIALTIAWLFTGVGIIHKFTK